MAQSLAAAGYSIREFILRTGVKPDRRVKTLAAKLRAQLTTFDAASLDADVIWIAVPDDAIESCATELARGRDLRGRVALHSAGALGSDTLRSMKKAGASVGSLHPMMSFPGKDSPSLRGVYFAIEGDKPAVQIARNIVADVGGHALSISAKNKALYHAFGSMIAPLMVAHLQAAQNIAKRAGVDERLARAAMRPIIEQVVGSFLAGGAEAAFSGPLKRGDANTTARHLKSLKKTDEDALYRALAQYAIEYLDVKNKKSLRNILR